jgi:predicted RNA binding protein YcfA (HicA-like mRNA interferase family)
MKSRELDRRVRQAGAKFLYQDRSSHKYYVFNGVVFGVPYHGAKEVPTGTSSKILKIIKGGKKSL